MAAVELKPIPTNSDLVAIARRLGQDFAKHAAEMDETDTFVGELGDEDRVAGNRFGAVAHQRHETGRQYPQPDEAEEKTDQG